MSEKTVQVIDRAFDVLELLAVERDGLGVTEIGKRLCLHKSTVHRLLSSMAERGYIQKIPGSGIYKMGLKLVELSSIYLSNVELKTEARPYMWDLATRMNLTTHLAILEGTDAVYIEKIDVVSSLRLYSQIGRRIPCYSSALGKSLLSGLSEGELAALLDKCSFKKHTGNTITTKSELIGQVKKVKLKGWSVDDEEYDQGIRCIAAPVLDYRGKVIAAISISGSSSALPHERDSETGGIVAETALKISNRLGYK